VFLSHPEPSKGKKRQFSVVLSLSSY